MLLNVALPLPPPGGAILLPSDELSVADTPTEHDGVIVSRDGRLALCGGGIGMSVKLSAQQAAALGLLLIEIGQAMDKQAQAAANAASEALDRITREVAGNA